MRSGLAKIKETRRDKKQKRAHEILNKKCSFHQESLTYPNGYGDVEDMFSALVYNGCIQCDCLVFDYEIASVNGHGS